MWMISNNLPIDTVPQMLDHSSPHACLTCPNFLTATDFVPQHQEQLDRTERLIAQAEADGRQRLLEMNTPIRLNVLRIIDGLETLEHDQPDGDRSPRGARGAIATTRWLVPARLVTPVRQRQVPPLRWLS
jgi:hypothetical protein